MTHTYLLYNQKQCTEQSIDKQLIGHVMFNKLDNKLNIKHLYMDSKYVMNQVGKTSGSLSYNRCLFCGPRRGELRTGQSGRAPTQNIITTDPFPQRGARSVRVEHSTN